MLSDLFKKFESETLNRFTQFFLSTFDVLQNMSIISSLFDVSTFEVGFNKNLTKNEPNSCLLSSYGSLRSYIDFKFFIQHGTSAHT